MVGQNRDLFSETISLLKQYKVHPRKKYSQNFLINPNLIEWHIEFADLSSEDEVLEIGPGLGFLTLALAQVVRQVTCVEVDEFMVRILQDRFKEVKNIRIIQGDILKVPDSVFDGKKVISNTPYKISSPLLFKLFQTQYVLALLTFQQEFARRLAASPGEQKYGRLTVNASRFATIKSLKQISRRCLD